MNGKVVIVTGATNGIGKVTAHELAAMGAEVVLISRSESKLANTVAEIKAATNNDNVSYIQADLSSLKEVREAAYAFLNDHTRLDVLVNNAGAFFSARQESVDGFEMTFALNHLNYFLLTNLLLDALKQTAEAYGEARIVNVSSDAHYGGKLKFEDLEGKQGYSGWGAYSQSKLMNVMFTYELSRHLEGTNVSANVLHPGFVDTGFGMNNGWFMSGLVKLAQRFMAISPDKGAETNIYLASAPEVKGITGKYWTDKKQKQSSNQSYDVEAQQRLWRISTELTGIDQPETATV